MVTLGLFGGTTAMQLLLLYILHVIVLTQRALRRKAGRSGAVPARICCGSACALQVHQLALVTQMLVYAQSWAMLSLLFFPVFSVQHSEPQLVGTSRFDLTHLCATAAYIVLLVLSSTLTIVCAYDTARAAGPGSEWQLPVLRLAFLFAPCAAILSGLLLVGGTPADVQLGVKYEGFAPHFEVMCTLQTAAAVFILAVVTSRAGFCVVLSTE
jgi:hypothetical protein